MSTKLGFAPTTGSLSRAEAKFRLAGQLQNEPQPNRRGASGRSTPPLFPSDSPGP